MITDTNIKTLIAFIIVNNKQGLIQAMNTTGNPVTQNISDDDLLAKAMNVFSTYGLSGIKNILSRVSIDKSKVTEKQKQVLTQIFKPDTTAARSFGDWFNDTVAFGADLLGGHSEAIRDPTVVNSTTQSPISSTIIIVVVIIAIVAVLILAFK